MNFNVENIQVSIYVIVLYYNIVNNYGMEMIE